MARCGWWDHFSWIHVWTEGFHLQLWFVNALLFFTISSGFTREVSRVCKSKGRGGVMGSWGVQFGDFYDLQFQSQSVRQPRGKDWLEEFEMKWRARRQPRGEKRQPDWWYQSFHSSLAWSSSSQTTQFSPSQVALRLNFLCFAVVGRRCILTSGGERGGSSGILDRFINVENSFLCMFLLSLCVTPRASVHSVLYVNCILPNYLFTEVSFFLIETYLKKKVSILRPGS